MSWTTAPRLHRIRVRPSAATGYDTYTHTRARRTAAARERRAASSPRAIIPPPPPTRDSSLALAAIAKPVIFTKGWQMAARRRRRGGGRFGARIRPESAGRPLSPDRRAGGRGTGRSDRVVVTVVTTRGRTRVVIDTLFILSCFFFVLPLRAPTSYHSSCCRTGTSSNPRSSPLRSCFVLLFFFSFFFFCVPVSDFIFFRSLRRRYYYYCCYYFAVIRSERVDKTQSAHCYWSRSETSYDFNLSRKCVLYVFCRFILGLLY